jgi:hypothetical protein
MPDERYRAVQNARLFLLTLLNPKETPRVPREIRRQARWVLKHFPHDYEMEAVAKKSPDVFEREK